MKAVTKMLRTLLGRAERQEKHITEAEAEAERQRIAEDLINRQHRVSARVHVLEWQVMPPAERTRESGEK